MAAVTNTCFKMAATTNSCFFTRNSFWSKRGVFFVIFSLFLAKTESWETEQQPRIVVRYPEVKEMEMSSVFQVGNESVAEYFTVLEQGVGSVLIGARNAVYNISLPDLKEFKDQRIEWPSSGAHRELCYLKGKSETDCHNYIRIGASETSSTIDKTSVETPSVFDKTSSAPVDRTTSLDGSRTYIDTTNSPLLICGTNSFKPLCRKYERNGDSIGSYKEEFEGTGVCPYDVRHNSTAVYTGRQLFSGTVADFSGGDPLIYRSPQRTERYDLRQLNGPQFAGSIATREHVLFFFRETAVEYMNCGKAVYSRVGRICKSDRGGPRHFSSRWTSFLKARLNCSIPGEYPFYFDEVQSVSEVVSGVYGGQANRIVYMTFTTAPSAIGGSAVCAFSLADIDKLLDTGAFKHQPDGINSNWLPLPLDQTPQPRPGHCVPDSRTMPDTAANFAKTHSLLDRAVPSLLGRPVMTRVSLVYRFSAVAVDPQVLALNSKPYDILYIGTDDGRVIKSLNVASPESINGSVPVVVSETQAVPQGEAIGELRVMTGQAGVRSLLVVTKTRVVSLPLHRCGVKDCRECIQLQDPHCAFDRRTQLCTSLDEHPFPSNDRFIQDITRGHWGLCKTSASWSVASNTNRDRVQLTVKPKTMDNPQELDPRDVGQELANEIVIDINELVGTDALNDASRDQERIGAVHPGEPLVKYSAQTMHTVIVVSCLATLCVGFAVGFLFSRRMRTHGPYSEQHNHRHLESNFSGTAQCSQYVVPPNNKNSNVPPSNINLLKNVSSNKQDNLQHELAKHSDCKNSTESLDNMGTLQKVKKTYI